MGSTRSPYKAVVLFSAFIDGIQGTSILRIAILDETVEGQSKQTRQHVSNLALSRVSNSKKYNRSNRVLMLWYF